MTNDHGIGQGNELWRYQIRLLYRHPRINPETITKNLGLNPDSSWVVGAPRKTPAGNALTGTYADSMWCHSHNVLGRRSFSEDIGRLIRILERHSDFVENITEDGGSARLIINLPGDTSIGDEIPWTDLSRMSRLKLCLGFEVFPNFT